MCETGRDCSPIAIGALVVEMVISGVYMLLYMYYHVTYGVLSLFQNCGYVTVYIITFLDILGGVLGILALRNYWPSNYSNYTPGMLCLLLACCFNCFVSVAFKSTLDINEMTEYLKDYAIAFGEAPGILQDIQQFRECCGISNYTDYYPGKVSDSCCGFKNCGQNESNYIKMPPCAHPNPGSGNSLVIKITPKGYGIIWAPYLLLFTRIIIICIYRCGMLDNIANGIPILIQGDSSTKISEANFHSVTPKNSSKSNNFKEHGPYPSSTGDDKYSVISPNITFVPEPHPHVIVRPMLLPVTAENNNEKTDNLQRRNMKSRQV